MDRASLQWVQEDVEQSLKQARINLESFLENADEVRHMLECAETLHGVHGVLEMLEVYGVSLLLDELEQVCRLVHDGKVARKDDACEVVMQGIVQVPEYLDFITRGNPENPMLMMPLLNDARSVRGLPLLSENSLFSPDLNAPLPFKPRPVALQGEAFVAYVRKLRPHYQKGLIAWYRGSIPADALNVLEAVIAHVQKLIGSSAAARLWLVARAVVDALKSGGLEHSVSIKLLLGRLDRQLRRFLQDADAATHEPGSPQLLKNLLYYCARSKPGSPRLEVVRSAFKLEQLLEPAAREGSTPNQIMGPNLQTIGTVVIELKDVLARARDGLDTYTRNEQRALTDLEPVNQLLSQVADTLGLLSLGVPRKLLVEQQQVIATCIASDTAPAENQLMDIAAAMLRVSGALDSVADKGIDGLNAVGSDISDGSEQTHLTGIEYLQLVTSVIGEAKSDIAIIKDTLSAYIVERQPSARLTEVPARVSQIVGGIRMLSLNQCATLFEVWMRHVDQVLINAATFPSEWVLEHIADGIESIDYYLEAVVVASGADADIRLAHATACIEALPGADFDMHSQSSSEDEDDVGDTIVIEHGESLEPDFGTGIDESNSLILTLTDATEGLIAANTNHAVDVAGSQTEPEQLSGLVVEVEQEAIEVEEIEIQDTTEEARIADHAVDSFAFESEQTVEDESPSTMVEVHEEDTTEEVVIEGGIDDEPDDFGISNVQLEKLDWTGLKQPLTERGDDEVALAFGALGVNVDESTEVGTATIDNELAQMPASLEASLLKARDLLDRMEADSMLGSEGASTSPEVAEPVMLLDDGIDEEIIDVFLEEADDVLVMFDEYLPRWFADPSNLVALTEIRRGYHMLKGSGRLVGATAIGEFCWAIEELLNRVIDDVVPVTQPVMDLVKEARSSLQAMLAELRGDGVCGVDVEDIQARAAMIGGVTDSDAPAYPTPSAVAEKSSEELPDDSLMSLSQPSSKGRDEVSAEILPFPVRREALENNDVEPSEETEEQSVRQVFCDEAREHLRALLSLLSEEEISPHAYSRSVHTLKGAARTAGLNSVSQIWEVTETLLNALVSIDGQLNIRMLDYIAQVRARSNETIAMYLENGREELSEAEHLVEEGRQLVGKVLEEMTTSIDQYGSIDSTMADRIELRDAFLEEAGEILDLYESVIDRWRKEGPTKRLLDELQRALHTLKGGARMAQLNPIGDLSHTLESVTSLVVNDLLDVDSDLLEVVEATQDKLADMLDCVVAHQHLTPASELIARIEALARGEVLPARTTLDEADLQVAARTSGKADGQQLEGGEMPVSPMELEASKGTQVVEDEIGIADRGERIPVDSELLDSLVGYAGELSVSQSRIELQVTSIKQNLGEMSETVSRLREQLRRLELETESQILYRHEREGGDEDFDPLEFDRFSRMQELSRGLAESVGDLNNIHDALNNVTRESESMLTQQGRTNAEMQHGLMQTRMLPFSRVVPRFRRVLRQTARELGKRVRLRVLGDEQRIDRAILNRIIGSLEHILRNCVDHGIETPAQRLAAGKPDEGMVDLHLTRDGHEIVIQISDDGNGVDFAAVRARAVERGLIGARTDVIDSDVIQFVFEPAFSTRATVTQISGRGVGLDVVQSEVKQLGGSVRIASSAGGGTRFEVRLPLTLAINQALMVAVGHEEFGVPLTNVDSIERITADEARIFDAQDNPVFAKDAVEYPIAYLGNLLSVAEPLYMAERYPVLLIRTGDSRIALRVDEIKNRSEVVVKSVGPMLSSIRWISGATIMGDGRVILILDAPALVNLASTARSGLMSEKTASMEPDVRGPTVMVVDDSITVRKVTGRFLQRNGINVVTARDGVEALTLLQEELPDVMLLDIEMPRMDGFELATTVRNDARMSGLPIIMITSRTGEKHMERAIQIGIDRYLGKPYQEIELLENINGLLLKEAHGV